eukprot:tig00000361_g24408.t1
MDEPDGGVRARAEPRNPSDSPDVAAAGPSVDGQKRPAEAGDAPEDSAKRPKVRKEFQWKEKTTTTFCKACGAKVLKTSAPLAQLPKRKTDGSVVVEFERVLRSVHVAEGETKLIKREKGVERQHRMECPSCDAVLGYRPNAFDEKPQFLYFFGESLTEDAPPPPPAPAEEARPRGVITSVYVRLPESTPAEAGSGAGGDRGAATGELKQFLAATQRDEYENVACSLHGKRRSLKYMLKSATGGYVCKPGHSCMVQKPSAKR